MYFALAFSYRQWHYRMTTARTEQPGGPAIGFSALLSANVFSLLMLLSSLTVPDWLFAAIPLLVGAGAFVVVSRAYRAHPIRVQYAQLRDNVPALREFPLVYAYLFCTLALFLACLFVAVHGAA